MTIQPSCYYYIINEGNEDIATTFVIIIGVCVCVCVCVCVLYLTVIRPHHGATL